MLRPALVVTIVLVLAAQMIVPPPPSYRLGCMPYSAGTHEELYNATIVTWNDRWDDGFPLDVWEYSEDLSLFVSSLWYPEGAQLTRLATCRGYYPIMETIQVPEYFSGVDICEVSPPSLWRRTTDYSLSIIQGVPELVLVLQNNDPGSSLGAFGAIRDIRDTWDFAGGPSVVLSTTIDDLQRSQLLFSIGSRELDYTNAYWQFWFPYVTNSSVGSISLTYSCCEAVNVSLVLLDYTPDPGELRQYPPTVATLMLTPDGVTVLSEPEIRLLPLVEDFGDFPGVWTEPEPEPTDTTTTTSEDLWLTLIFLSGGTVILVIALYRSIDRDMEVKV